MSSITEKIDAIIEQRKQHLPAVNEAITKLEECFKHARAFEETCILSLNPASNGEFSSIFKNSNEIDDINSFTFSEFYKIYETYHERLLQLRSRFERDKLHISFVGTAGQGKSLIMQQISGLDGSVIPSAEGSDCTGATSVITNVSDAQEVRAKISFFTQSEMIEIMNKYLEEIDPGHSLPRITQISDVTPKLQEDVTKLKESSRGNGAFAQTLLNYIGIILEGTLNDLYGKTDVIVPEEQIEEYVAQFSSKDKSVRYYKYLGVKSANIECRFPHDDAGKIVLVDTIGIGANSIGVEDDILRTIRYNSDIVVMMDRPDPIRYRLDAVHSRFAKQIIEAATPECSPYTFFWVLNRVRTGTLNNEHALESVKKDIIDSQMPVGDILTVDCISKEDVENNMITPILEKLSTYMNKVDNMLIEQANQYAADAAKAIADAINLLSGIQVDPEADAFGESKDYDIMQIYDNEMLGSLRDYIETNYKTKTIPDPATGQIPALEEFVAESVKTLRKVLTLLPKEDDISSYLGKGSVDVPQAYDHFGTNLRMDILAAFGSLDIVLDELVNRMKSEIVDILIEKGHLGAILPKEEATEEKWAVDWIGKFLDKIQAKTRYRSLYIAFTEFKDFEFHADGFLTYRIRVQLDKLDYHGTAKNSNMRNSVENRQALASEIYRVMEHDLEEVYDRIRLGVKELYKEPGAALWAAADNFYLRATFLENPETKMDPRYEWM